MNLIILIVLGVVFTLIEHSKKNKGLIKRQKINQETWNLGVVLDIIKVLFFITIAIVFFGIDDIKTILFILLYNNDSYKNILNSYNKKDE